MNTKPASLTLSLIKEQVSRRSFLKIASLGAGAAAISPSLMANLYNKEEITSKVLPFRVGEWLPSDQAFLDQWVERHVKAVDTHAKPLHPVIEEFKNLIENDPEIYMLINQMFEQIPKKSPYNKNPIGKSQVRDYPHMLNLINAILTTAPEFNKTGLVGFPINAILDWAMGTSPFKVAQHIVK